jgi:transposase
MDTATTTATTPTIPATATEAAPILALDLGKYKSVACCYDRATAAHRFQTLDTSRDGLRRLCEQHRPGVVVFEACALAGWVYDLCAELGLPCKVANTASEAWKFKHTKRKTDKDDARRLAQLEALGQLPTVVIPPKQTREWRALIGYRQALVGRRVTLQNQVRALLVGQGLPAPRGHRAWTAIGLEGIGQHARALADCAPEELWRGLLGLALEEHRQVVALLGQAEARLDAEAEASEAVQLLTSTPGVGPRTAEAIAAYLPDPGRFTSGKQVGAYVGMVPRQYQSGETDRRGRITKRGPALLRKLLVECAWVMLRYNAWARAVYLRLSKGKARKKQAIVALARKLLVRCWAMLRDKTRWREDIAAAVPT